MWKAVDFRRSATALEKATTSANSPCASFAYAVSLSTHGIFSEGSRLSYC